jgi:hypothetical protein
MLFLDSHLYPYFLLSFSEEPRPRDLTPDTRPRLPCAHQNTLFWVGGVDFIFWSL